MLISTYEICLERVAEELMGRRKWKQYQEALTRSQLSADITNLDQIGFSSQKLEPEQKLEKAKENSHQQQQPFENDVPIIKTEVFDERTLISPHIKKENFESNSVVTGESIKLNNNTTASHSIHLNNNNSKKDNEEQLPPPTTSPTPPPAIPIDWTPNEKCNFCVDGKLLTVNEKGELVAESSPALSEADLANRPPGDTDSDSSDSLVPDARVNASKILTSRLRDPAPPNMTSLESMAAQWSAIQSLPGLQSGLGQLYPSILYNLTQHVNSATPTTSETSAAAISPPLKDSPSPSDLTGEQPLDLSSKPSPNSSIGGDARHVRAKPRVTPCTGRRTYTEEELNSALQDIMSGRLGTRRAAVQYNIPRSTLRNKVYKISSGVKRETPTSMRHLASLEDLADADDDKQDLSADEEDSSGDKILSNSLASHGGDDLASRFADATLAASIQKICAEQNSLTAQQQQQQQQQQHHQPHSDHQVHNKPTTSLESQPKRKSATPQPPPPQTSPIGQNAWQNVLLQSLLISSGLPIQQNFEETLQLFNALLMKQDPSLINPQLLMQLQQSQQSPQSAQQQQQHHHHHHHQQQQNQQHHHLHSNAAGNASAAAAAAAAASFQNRQPKSETPETASSVDLNETLVDDPSVILKIPSYKPVAGCSTSSTSAAAAVAAALCNNKNGENLPSSSPKMPTAANLLGANTSTQQLHHHHHLHQHHNSAIASANNIPGISPPLLRHTSGESQSPPTLSLRDVIANSISRTFSQQANKDNTSPSPAHSSSSAMDHNDQYKRPSISVIKNIGGTDTSRFATAPNLLGGHHANSNHHHHQHHHHQHHSQNAANNNLAGGKGTRPKRGKYRNYDRDSLVEAVKAVQRGEMSVHRAGSYYGVPHSTLEYKVKERHLMRPRKREPKPQPPLDDRTGGSTSGGNTSGSSANTSKNSNIPGLSAVNSLDKLSKGSGAAGTNVNQKQSAAGKSNPPFPTTSPNGMKIPSALFEPNLAAQLQYPPHLFWHGGFGPLQMDFSPRSQAAAAVAAAAAASSGPGNPSFAANAEFLKSQMLQRFHEERGPPNAIGSPPAPASISNSTSSTNNAKSVRDIAENLYDPGSANGSFLDGIIRKTLDRNNSDIALLDQLAKNSKPPPPRLMMNNDRSPVDLLKLKRSASPMQYHSPMDIKRERASPTSDSSNSDSERNHQRDTDSEPLPPQSQHHAVGLHHALLGASSDLNGAQHGTSSENNLPTSLSASSSSAVTTSILHEKLGQIKSEAEDSL